MRAFVSCRRGATAIEYGLIVCLIGLIAAASLHELGTNMWTHIAQALPQPPEP